MKRLTIFIILISLGLLLVACGGSSGENEPAPVESNSSNEKTVAEEPAAEEMAEEETEVEEPAAEEESSSEATEEETTEEEPVAEEETTEEEEPVAEEAAASGFGDLPLTGTDAETGLAINPPKVNPGDSAVIRGEIISMNLTPTTSPEYLIQIEDGTKYRFRGQDLVDTYFLDGSQLKAFEYKLGMLAQATITLAADAGPSDLAVSDNLTLIAMGE